MQDLINRRKILDSVTFSSHCFVWMGSCSISKNPYLVNTTPFIRLISDQTGNVYQIWLESKLVNAVFRRLSNVKYGTACGRSCTRAFLLCHLFTGGEKSRPLEVSSEEDAGDQQPPSFNLHTEYYNANHQSLKNQRIKNKKLR